MKRLTIPLCLLFSSISITASSSNPDIRIINSDATKTVLEITFTKPPLEYDHGYHKLLMPLEGTTRSAGKPELPVITRFVAIPHNTSCTARITSLSHATIENVEIIPHQIGTDYAPSPWNIDDWWYQQDRWFPEETIDLGQPAVLRDVRIVPLTIFPFAYHPLEHQIRMIDRITIELHHHPDPVSRTVVPERVSHTFNRWYEKHILNYAAVRGTREEERGTFLIIVPDALYNTVLPLADWKHKRGDRTVVKKTSEVGSVNSQIRNYISTAYLTWDPPIDHVLLIGDVDLLPPFYDYDPRHGTYASDLDYSLLAGGDLFPEILLGRISVDNAFELEVVVAKILDYEISPYSPSSWLGNFLCVAGQDFSSQVETKIWVQEFVDDFGYVVDTLFARNGATATMISNAINNGRAYVNYRGGGWGYGWREPYYTTTDILVYLNNGWRLPVMTSVNCGAGKFNWSSGECFGELWIRSGTPSNPKGGVAFVGASHWTYASRNNALDVGMYRAIYNDSLTVLGAAMNAGKLFMYQCYPEMDTTRVTYGVYHILGDPTLNLWTSVPTSINVIHPATIPIGNGGIDVEVKDHNNLPLANALVCLSKGTEVYAYDYTNDEGICAFQVRPTTAGAMDVTVTGLNRIPYESTVTVVSNGLYLGYRSHSIDDDNTGGSSGNNDGYVNPGETIEMIIVVENFGSQTAFNVTGLLRSADGSLIVTDSLETYGTIPAGDSLPPAEDFDLAVPDTVRYGDSLELSLFISDNDSTWYSHLALPVYACRISYQSFTFIDGANGKPEPGDTGDLTVTVGNQGNANAEGLNAILSTADPYITIIDSTGSFGDIAPGSNASNSSNRFTISISPQVHSGYEATLYLSLTAGYYEDTLSFSITVEPTTNTNPMGPDDYGYYAYDSNDTLYTEAPVYNWVELDPGYGGNGTLLPLGEDGTSTLPVPFSFPFYGVACDSVSICANGWIKAGSTNLGTYTNWPIPDTYGPSAMIAPFWDDLSDSLPMPNHVYYAYDNTNHRFIIEWSRIYHTYADSIPHPGDPETFEAILYDPAYNPTLTGDGEILYQYMSIINPLSSTVGIEDHNESTGIQYVYNGIYASGASEIDDGIAIKLTTDPPVLGVEEEKHHPEEIPFSLTAFPNPFTSITRFQVRGTGEAATTRIEIFDIAGRLVRILSPAAGDSRRCTDVMWDGRDSRGIMLHSGIYIARIHAASAVYTRKLIKLPLD